MTSIFPKRTGIAIGLVLAFFALFGGDCDNNAPVLAAIGDYSIMAGQPFSLQLAATDEDGDPLTYYVVGAPGDAVFDPTTGLFEWTPGYWDLRVYEITFGVSDGEAEDEETIELHVEADIDFVEIYLVPDYLELNVGESYRVTATGVRSNGDEVEDIFVNFEIDDEAVATAGYTGTVTGVADGATTLNAWLHLPEELNDSIEVVVGE